MKKLHHFFSTSFLLLILSFFGFGQNPVWVAKYISPANKGDQARAMTTDAAGNIYITGPSDGGQKTNLDFVTVKYTPNGNLAWSARYNGPNNGEDWPYAIAVDVAGNVYVTGRSFTSKSGGSSYNFDYATVKYNPDGGLVWAKRFGSAGNRNDIPQDIKVDDGGNAYVTGYADASLVLGNGNSIVTIKYNPSGDTAWTAKYDVLLNLYDGSSTNMEEAFSLALDADGNVYIAGTVLVKYNSNGSKVWENRSNDDRREILVDQSNNIFTTGFSGKTSKYDGSGNLIWQSIYPNTGFWDMALDQTGNVYVTGSGNSTYETVKYDANTGVQGWSATYFGSGNSSDFARSIAVDNLGNAYVTGHTTVASGRTTAVKIGTIKYNSTGQQQWLSLYDGDGFGIAADISNNIYVAGTYASTKTTPGGIVALKYAPGSTATKSVTSNAVFENRTASIFGLHNYPNPFYQNTTIEYQLPKDVKVKLSVFDLLGNEVATLVNETKLAGVHKANFKADRLPAGAYVYRIQAGEYIETKKIIVIK